MLKFLFALALLLTFCNADSKPNPARIAVIGGGIGGMSSIYFLKEKFGQDVPIDLYEPKSTLCGRVATVNINGREYESGASIIHPKNMHMKNFVETFGLNHSADIDGTTAIFDGQDYILKTSTWSIITFFKMLWLYGLDLFWINKLESHFMKDFSSIYDLQEQGYSYDDVESLLRAIGNEEFVNATKVSARKMFSDRGIGSLMIDTLITAALRNNYGQDTKAHGFVGTVAMAGIESGLWSVYGGNKMVCEKIFEATKPNLIHEQVSSITYIPERASEAFSITTVENPNTTRNYDIVILAAPVGPNTYNIDLSKACEEFVSCPSADAKDMEYQQTVSNYIVGKLNSSLFQCNSKRECPANFLIPNTTKFYWSIGLETPVDYDPEIDTENVMIYKVFTTDPMTKEQISYLFESYNELTYVKWHAYPYYHVPQKLSSLVLNRAGLYYTSPIEWAASAMEMSTISGKNAALLAYNYWFGLKVKMNKVIYDNGEKIEL